jgi:DNA-binding PadR family transcriptional regulator
MAFVLFYIKTIYIEQNKRLYRRKTPTLQIEILSYLALNGKVSKSKIKPLLKEKHDYPNISNAFDALRDNGLIMISHKKPGRGCPEVYYKITEKGLRFFIAHDPVPLKFWRAMMVFCYYSQKQVTLDKVEEFYQLFIRKYLRYSSGHGYSFQLDSFNEMCKDWIQNMILNTDRINLAQKVLEVLAINPAIPLNELAKKTKEYKEMKVKKVLSSYTSMSHKPLIIDPTGKVSGEVFKSDNWKFLLHNVVTIRRNAKVTANTYELSLFGVIVMLTLVRYHDMDRLKQGLYYSNISFQDYYDKIATNYRDKLSLVFGKWNLLKRILKIFSTYNFDIILDKEFRSKIMSESALMGGNREFYDNTVAVALHSNKQLGEVQMTGLEEFANYVGSTNGYSPGKNIQESQKHAMQKTNAVFQMINIITISLNLSSYDPKTFREDEWGSFNSAQVERLSHLYEINIIEKAFAEEITFLYYLKLRSDYYFQVMQPMNSLLISKASMPDDVQTLLSPKQSLGAIVKQDKEIREWFSTWMDDLVNYQQEILKTMTDFSEEIIRIKK